jgi:outer membrane usher protein
MRPVLPAVARVMAVILAAAPPAARSRAEPAPAASGAQDEGASLILSLTVNGERVEDSVLALQRDDGFYLPVSALTQHRIRVPEAARRIAGPGADYVRLAELPAVTVHFDSARQDLALTVAEDGMERQVLDLSQPPKNRLQPSAPGAYLNYDAIAQSDGASSYFATMLEAGTPLLGGNLSSTGVLRGGDVGGLGGNAPFIRLDTAFLREFQDDLTQLKFGDSISRGGAWGNPLRFGGIQYGTNFAVQPGYVAYPTASFAGQAALPSTVDVYINDALRYRGDVNQGPFELNQIPAVTGGGNAQVVMTDMLGRQQAISLPFYVDSTILRAGTSDFSYEAGFLRDDYGIKGSDYGALLVSATYRYGLSDNHTVEGHAEGTLNRRAAGISLTSVFVPLGEFEEELAGGQGPAGPGWLAGLGVSHQTNAWSLGIRQTWESRAFDAGAVSFASSGTVPRSQSQANLGVNLGRCGSLSFSLARQRDQAEAAATVASATWTLAVNDRAFLNAYGLNTRQGQSNTTVGLTLTFLFGNSFSATIDGSMSAGDPLANVQFRHSPSGETGWDYGVNASAGGVQQVQADVTRRTDFGDFGAAVDQQPEAASGRLTASGGIALVGDKVFATRRINDAFGLVSVAGYPGVTVFQDNRPIGETDEDGDLFVPTLLSNNPNRIGIATSDLPVDADIDRLDATATPGYRGIARIEFHARPSAMRLIVLTGAGGKPVEAGIEVRRIADNMVFHAGYGGEVYLDGDTGQEFGAESDGAACRFRLPPPGTVGSVPTLVCEAAR